MKLSVRAASNRARKKCRKVRVLLNGVDVSNRCQAANDRDGRVLLFERAGKVLTREDLDARGRLKKRWHQGRVTIVRAS